MKGVRRVVQGRSLVRVAALYDIHGNAPALEAVVEELERVNPDLVVVGGDVLAGPLPLETLHLLRTLPREKVFVRGNADRALLEHLGGSSQAAEPADTWMADRLTQADIDLIALFRDTFTARIDGLGTVTFCHATPRSDEEIVTSATPEEVVHDAFAGAKGWVCVCGHTHVQYDRRAGDFRIVNPGSVGMPYEDAGPGAYWALLGPDVELRRTTYDLQAAAERIRIGGWEQAADFAREHVLSVPSGTQATDYFEGVAGRG